MHRKLLDSRVFADAELLKVWVWCLCRASHKETYVPMRTGTGKTTVNLQPGQLLFGRNSAAKQLDMPPSSLYKRIKKLVAEGNLSIKRNTHYSVVTVCNWETYQAKEQPEEQPEDNQVATREQAGNTYKKAKKAKKAQNAENDETRRDDHLISCSWNELEKSLVIQRAREVNAKMRINLSKREDNRSLTLKACYLVWVCGEMPEDWIWDSVEAVRQARPTNPAGYWYKCLENKANALRAESR